MIQMMAALLAAASAPTPCPALAGADALLAEPGIRWIVVGEVHGTAEMPAAFGDLACRAAMARPARPLVIGLERSVTEQPALDTYLRSDGGAAAQAALTAGLAWRRADIQDGRSSLAYLRLIDRLRSLRQAGRIARVVLFQSSEPDAAAHERAMAAILAQASPTPAVRVLALAGNLHARLTPWPWPSGPTYAPMASYLPRTGTRTIDMHHNGGTAWVCQGSGSSSCGMHSAGAAAAATPPRGIVREDASETAYDFILDVGGPTTASPPAVAEGG